MAKLEERHRSDLETRFGSRISFDRVERKLYGHDIAVFPSLFKPLIGKTVPEAVVQPENEQELVDLVKWIDQQGIELADVHIKRPSLEDVFIELTGKTLRE